MTESKEPQPATGAGGDHDGQDEGGGINDPLTRRDVEAPRAPFEAHPPAGA